MVFILKYGPKTSLWILMELWHFEFLEEGPKTQKSAKNRHKLDLSILVFIFSRARPLVRSCEFFSGIALGANEAPEKIWTAWAFRKPEK